jgi:hypothetical protein
MTTQRDPQADKVGHFDFANADDMNNVNNVDDNASANDVILVEADRADVGDKTNVFESKKRLTGSIMPSGNVP